MAEKIYSNSAELIAAIQKDTALITTISTEFLKTRDGQKMLNDYADELKRFIWQALQNYYRSYHPSYYPYATERRGRRREETLIYPNARNPKLGLRGALKTSGIEMRTNSYGISIVFDEKAFARSYWSKKTSEYSKAELLNEGWEVDESAWFSNIEHFGYFEGIHFIENGIEKFKSKHPEVSITLIKNLGNGKTQTRKF